MQINKREIMRISYALKMKIGKWNVMALKTKKDMAHEYLKSCQLVHILISIKLDYEVTNNAAKYQAHIIWNKNYTCTSHL